MERNEAKAIIENVLFVADAPLPAGKITSVFGGELKDEEVASILAELAKEFEGRALMIAEVAEGWRIQTRPEYAAWITTFFKMEKGQRLSRASLEVLAIVAYRQPITRTEMDEIRGVDCGGVLRGLIDKSLVKTMGRRRAPGRPMMYGTTGKFLEFFGLARLSDLPTLEEFRAELGDGLDRLAPSQPGLPFDVPADAQSGGEAMEEQEDPALPEEEGDPGEAEPEDGDDGADGAPEPDRETMEPAEEDEKTIR
jgi:segregation and condensation protein B